MENPVKPEAPIRVHIRNTRWETPENQAIFTITPEHFAEAVRSHPDLASSLEPSFGIGADDFDRPLFR